MRREEYYDHIERGHVLSRGYYETLKIQGVDAQDKYYDTELHPREVKIYLHSETGLVVHDIEAFERTVWKDEL